jgi:hypothetical protein
VLATDLWEFSRKESVDEAHKQALRTAAQKESRSSTELLRIASEARDPLERLGALFVVYAFSLDPKVKSLYKSAVQYSLRETTEDAFTFEKRQPFLEYDSTSSSSSGSAAASAASASAASASASSKSKSPFSMSEIAEILGLLDQSEETIHERAKELTSLMSQKPPTKTDITAEKKKRQVEEEKALQEAVQQAMADAQEVSQFEERYLKPIRQSLPVYQTTIMKLRMTMEIGFEELQSEIRTDEKRLQSSSDPVEISSLQYQILMKSRQFVDVAKTVLKFENSARKKQIEFLESVNKALEKVRISAQEQALEAILGITQRELAYIEKRETRVYEQLETISALQSKLAKRMNLIGCHIMLRSNAIQGVLYIFEICFLHDPLKFSRLHTFLPPSRELL